MAGHTIRDLRFKTILFSFLYFHLKTIVCLSVHCLVDSMVTDGVLAQKTCFYSTPGSHLYIIDVLSCVINLSIKAITKPCAEKL